MADLVYSMGANTAQFQGGMNAARRNLYQMDSALRDTNGRLTKSMSGFNTFGRGLLELSRGAEDFAIVYGTQGLSGGLRAASNNLSQFAAIMHPMAGVVVGLGTAIATALVPSLFGTSKAAKESKKDLVDWSDSINRIKDAATDLKAIVTRGMKRRELADMGGSQMQELKRNTVDEMREIQAEIDANRAELNRLAQPLIGDLTELLAAPKRRSESPFSEIAGQINGLKVPDETMKRIREIEQAMFELHNANGIRGFLLNDINAELPDARRRDEEERRAKEAEIRRKDDEAAEKERQRRLKLHDDLSRSLTDELDPDGAAGRKIIDQLKERFKTIDEEFGGDQQLKDRAERSAREQAARLGETSGKVSPAALEQGSSAAVGLINRLRNQSISVDQKQLQAAQELNAKIDELIDVSRHPPDLPPSEFN